nr:dipeptidase [Bacteroides sp. 224]
MEKKMKDRANQAPSPSERDGVRLYIQENESAMMEDLFSLIRIPSISAKPEHKADMQKCAERWKELLLEAGADEVEIMPSAGNPIVFGKKIIDPKAKTVLVYAHYDVMPAEPFDLWKSEPFEAEIRDGYIWARGADDDKGQAFIQVKAFEYLVKNNLLTTNVKFIFEGEEEIGSPSLEAFCKEHKELLKSDIILVSDTSMLGADLPSLTTGLRGLAYWEIEVTGPNRDLHSGHFGGAVANPINTLCSIIDKVIDKDGRITIPGFYDDVEELSKEERDMIASIPFNEEKYKASIGVKELFGEKGYSTLERNSCRPSFDVCGIWGGYTGEGSKTVLPSKAYAKVSCRLVPHQEHHKISQMFIDYIASIVPDTVQVKVTPMHGGEGYVCPITLPAYKAAEKGFEVAFGKKPLAVRRGGSIPIISTFEQVLGVKTVLMGFGLESDAIHSPNENFSLDIFRKGIVAVVEFYKAYGEM